MSRVTKNATEIIVSVLKAKNPKASSASIEVGESVDDFVEVHLQHQRNLKGEARLICCKKKTTPNEEEYLYSEEDVEIILAPGVLEALLRLNNG